MVRMERESAAVVARRASGTTIKATVADGTRTPPMPKELIVPSATASLAVSGVVAARPPAKAAGRSVSILRKKGYGEAYS